MAIANGRSTPSETSPLLADDVIKPVDSLPGVAVEYGTANGKAVYKSPDGEAAEDEDVNPLFEGQPEMVKRLYMLVPAVGLGVSETSWLFQKKENYKLILLL